MKVKRRSERHVEIRHDKPIYTLHLDGDNVIVSTQPVKSAIFYYK